jgi:hypothetical protein
VLGSLAQAGELVKLDVPADQIAGLLAVSQKHGLVFVSRTIVPESGLAPSRSIIVVDSKSGLAPVRSTVVVDLKTGKTIPIDIPASRVILVSPSLDLALGLVGARGQWIYDLAARKMLRIEEAPAVEGRHFTQWWGEKMVYGKAYRKGGEVAIGPLRVEDGRTGKAVAFPDMYVMPLAGSPDGKQLVVCGVGKDVTQPVQDMIAQEKTAKSLPMIRVDAQGKELAREEIKKGSLRKFSVPIGRIWFDPTSRFLLTGTLELETAKTVYNAVQSGQMNIARGTISAADVLNLKTGKRHTIPALALSKILGFDGRQIIQKTWAFANGDTPMAIGKLGESSIAAIANVPRMSGSQSCVEQTAGGMMIYWIAPGTNMLQSLPVDKVKTRPWPVVTQPKKPTDAAAQESRESGGWEQQRQV